MHGGVSRAGCPSAASSRSVPERAPALPVGNGPGLLKLEKRPCNYFIPAAPGLTVVPSTYGLGWMLWKL